MKLPNYLVKMMELSEKHPEIRGHMVEIEVRHDLWCPKLRNGGLCVCDPEISLLRSTQLARRRWWCSN